MRLLRGLLGALLWILAALLGLVGVLLCVTVILLPVGIPIVKLAGSLFVRSMRLMLPPALAHPVGAFTSASEKKGHLLGSAISDAAHDAAKTGRKAAKSGRKAAKTGRKAAKRQRKRLERVV
jgi:hypothetical protein